MANPSSDGASHDCWNTNTKNVDVHYNSGIGNLAFYLLAQGGKHPRTCSSHNVSGIGIEKAMRILYRANDLYYTTGTTYT